MGAGQGGGANPASMARGLSETHRGGVSPLNAVALLRKKSEEVSARLLQVAELTAEQRKRLSELVAQGRDRDEAVAEAKRRFS
jgi:hypothetical protein